SEDDVECRRLPRILDRIVARDPAPLDVARPPERRFIGICRDYALLACAALRHHGVPARLRVGFATYFTPGYLEDHWVCEYHAGDRWRLLDPELAPRVRTHFKIAFDPTDVPRDAFLVAGDVWQRTRAGAIDPETCGVPHIGIVGRGFIAASLVRDLAALNRREMLAWDVWGLPLGHRAGVAAGWRRAPPARAPPGRRDPGAGGAPPRHARRAHRSARPRLAPPAGGARPRRGLPRAPGRDVLHRAPAAPAR